MATQQKETISTKIWREESEDDNPFVAKVCYCSGFDIFGDLLGKISLVEYLFLLFRLEPPTSEQARLFENVAVMLANPGPRDHSVQAAMNAAVSGSPRASAMMAALGVGAGNLSGGREIWQALQYWESCGEDLAAWRVMIANPPAQERLDIWMPMEHCPGFDPNGATCPLPVRQALSFLASISPATGLPWLSSHRQELEQETGCPLAFSGVAAAAFRDLGFSAEQAESLYLLLRLPGAMAHALEQESQGWRRFPFFKDGLKLKDYDDLSTTISANS